MDFEEYLDAWNSYEPDVFKEFFAEDARYDDLAARLTWRGREAIRKMAGESYNAPYHFVMTYADGFQTNEKYALEWDWSVTYSDGSQYGGKAISTGEFDTDGRIIHNRDYWNPADKPGWSEEFDKKAHEVWGLKDYPFVENRPKYSSAGPPAEASPSS